MPDVAEQARAGRGERVLPGLFRLRLPLPWPGVPHCNAWAVARGDGFVLFDTGMHEPDSIVPPRARAGDVRPAPRAGAAWSSARTRTPTTAGRPSTILERAGCELWMHPSHEHHEPHGRGPRGGVSRGAWRSRARAACPRSRCAATPPSAAARGSGIVGPIEPDRDLLTGMVHRHRPRRVGRL